jgi:hypothetical protein
MLLLFNLINFFSFFSYVKSHINQIHIAQGKTPDSMTISWLTNNYRGSNVMYGVNKSNLNFIEYGFETSYHFDYPDINVYQSGTIHHVVLSNLIPATTYYYICGDISTDTQSDLLMFTTPDPVGSFYSKQFGGSVTFGVIGDLGQTDNSEKTLAHISKDPSIQMILHPGDLSYADCNQELWDSYGEMIEPVASRIPWMVGPGNHELELTNDQQFYLAFEERYKMPQVKQAKFGPITIPPKYHDDDLKLPYCCSSIFQSIYDYGNSFYSFNTAAAHIIYLKPYTTSNETSEQYKWLESDLEQVDRKISPWLIVVIHCPWYSSNTDHYEEKQTVLMRQYMEPLFYKYKVNIAIMGHVHAYERTHPVFKNKTNPFGTIYITVGDGGNLEGHAKEYYEQPEWSAYRNGTQYGYGTISLLNANRLQWKWYRNKDDEYVYSDSVTICNSIYKTVYC